MLARFISGKQSIIGPGIKYPVPIALDPASYEGAWVYGDDGEMHRSNGTEWKSVVQLAEDVSNAANVARFIEPATVLTVGAGGDYPSLRAVFEYLLGFINNNVDGILPVTVRILSGHVIGDDQVILTGTVGLSWVVVESEDALVDVDAALFTRPFPNAAA